MVRIFIALIITLFVLACMGSMDYTDALEEACNDNPKSVECMEGASK